LTTHDFHRAKVKGRVAAQPRGLGLLIGALIVIGFVVIATFALRATPPAVTGSHAGVAPPAATDSPAGSGSQVVTPSGAPTPSEAPATLPASAIDPNTGQPIWLGPGAIPLSIDRNGDLTAPNDDTKCPDGQECPPTP
jgi:hypothetical protein